MRRTSRLILAALPKINSVLLSANQANAVWLDLRAALQFPPFQKIEDRFSKGYRLAFAAEIQKKTETIGFA